MQVGLESLEWFPKFGMCHVCLDDEAILALGPNDIFMSLTTV